MIRPFTLTTVALLLLSWSATAGIPSTAAQKAVEKILSQEPFCSSAVGVFALRMDGDTLVALNIGQKMVPASNMKLLTTGVALNTLGADFRFETAIGYTGEIKDGTLTGDLYIIGGGDPTTGSRSDCAEPLDSLFGRWFGFVKDMGISRIDGRVIGDPRFLNDPVPENPGWLYEDLGTAYGAGPQGLNFFENRQDFRIAPGPTVGIPVSVSVMYPDAPWMRVSCSAVTGNAKSENSLFYVNTSLSPYSQVCGSFPADARSYRLECSNRFGAYTCAYYFCNYLKKRGVSVSGGFGDVTSGGFLRTDLTSAETAQRAPLPNGIVRIGSTFSAPLWMIVRDANRMSDNFFAETLLKITSKSKGSGVQYAECSKVMSDCLRSMGLPAERSCQIFDGSGLSRKNYVSPEFFVSFLRLMVAKPLFDIYLDSLPVPGAKGTLEYRLPSASPQLRSRIHAKSGSMNGVRCYSGYILPSDGNPEHIVVFSLMTNNVIGQSWSVNPYIDKILEALAADN